MLAVRLHRDGLRLDEMATPTPGPGEVLIRVRAAAITRDELDWPVDRLPAIPSYELSGTVVETGEDVYALTPFDRDGVAAEFAVVPEAVLSPKPQSLSHVEAAAVPMGGLSAWQGLFEYGGLQRGERVIVTGSRGGVGHLALQIARSAGAEVVTDGPAELVFVTTRRDASGRQSGRHHRGRAPRGDLLRRRAEPRPARSAHPARRRRRAAPRDRLDLSARASRGGLRASRRPRQAWQSCARCRRLLARPSVRPRSRRFTRASRSCSRTPGTRGLRGCSRRSGSRRLRRRAPASRSPSAGATARRRSTRSPPTFARSRA